MKKNTTESTNQSHHDGISLQNVAVLPEIMRKSVHCCRRRALERHGALSVRDSKTTVVVKKERGPKVAPLHTSSSSIFGLTSLSSAFSATWRVTASLRCGRGGSK